MILELKYEKPTTNWSPLFVFDGFCEWLKINNKEHTIIHKSTQPHERKNTSGTCSPHIMTITNIDNGKYIIISYWDKAVELTFNENGWNSSKMVDFITSSGVFDDMKFTPFSYLPYSVDIEDYIKNNRKKFHEKNNNSLFFRGYIYGDRDLIKKHDSEIFLPKIERLDYYNEINNSKICLSLNGAGEICNRDIEILGVGSVLLRPKLTQKFHNELIPDFHYISVEKDDNMKEQLKKIKEKYNEIKNNHNLLKQISKNGNDWYTKNGTIESNINILKKIINFKKLN